MTLQGQKLSVQAVLFDLDGTLLDSSGQYRRGLAAAFKDSGFRPPPAARIRQSMGLPGLDAVRALGVPPGRARAVWLRWTEWDKRLADLVHPFPGVESLLERLRAAGYHLGVVTSRCRENLEAIPAAVDLLPQTGLLVTRDDTTEGKPHPAPLLHAFELLGLPPSQGIYVGDAPVDIETGRRAGCITVLATWDSTRRGRPAETQPDFVVASLDELAALLLE